MDVAAELIKLGPAGLICVLLLIGLRKSEDREHKKDIRIQYLENQLIQSYDERIAAADRLADALHGNAATIKTLVDEIRARRR